jgi:REP element-mobilizing transposase RayT
MPKTRWSTRGYLPHFDAADIWQAITYRLSDAVPAHVVASMERELAALPDDERSQMRRERLEVLANAGHGSCVLASNAVAEVVHATWRRFAGERYDLGPWVIMPNHVHVLIRVNPGHTLSVIVGSWKSYTAKRILTLTGRSGPLWWPDYWDRYIRDLRHWEAARIYIEQNPVAAGLIESSTTWRWSSAWTGA